MFALCSNRKKCKYINRKCEFKRGKVYDKNRTAPDVMCVSDCDSIKLYPIEWMSKQFEWNKMRITKKKIKIVAEETQCFFCGLQLSIGDIVYYDKNGLPFCCEDCAKEYNDPADKGND